jgi:hypothetical protein
MSTPSAAPRIRSSWVSGVRGGGRGAELAAALSASLHGRRDIVVGLAGARFIGIEGLRMLVRAARAKTGGRVLVLRRVPPGGTGRFSR